MPFFIVLNYKMLQNHLVYSLPQTLVISSMMPGFFRIKVLVTQSCLTLCDPMTVAHHVPLSMEFSREGYWSELP